MVCFTFSEDHPSGTLSILGEYFWPARNSRQYLQNIILGEDDLQKIWHFFYDDLCGVSLILMQFFLAKLNVVPISPHLNLENIQCTLQWRISDQLWESQTKSDQFKVCESSQKLIANHYGRELRRCRSKRCCIWEEREEGYQDSEIQKYMRYKIQAIAGIKECAASVERGRGSKFQNSTVDPFQCEKDPDSHWPLYHIKVLRGKRKM